MWSSKYVGKKTAAVAQWAKAVGLGVRIPATTDLVVKSGSDSSTAKRSAVGVSVTGPQRWSL